MEPSVVPDFDSASTPTTGEELPPRKAIDWLFVIMQIGRREVSLAVFVVVLALAAIKTKYLDPHPLAQIAFILARIWPASASAAGISPSSAANPCASPSAC